MLESGIGCEPWFERYTTTLNASPGFGTWGVASNTIAPGSSAPCVPCLTVTPAESSKPTSPPLAAALASVRPGTKLLTGPPPPREPPEAAASARDFEPIAACLPFWAAALPGSSASARS